MIVRITRSQQMALMDVLVEHVRAKKPQEFVDLSTGAITTVPQLLNVVQGATWEPADRHAEGQRASARGEARL